MLQRNEPARPRISNSYNDDHPPIKRRQPNSMAMVAKASTTAAVNAGEAPVSRPFFISSGSGKGPFGQCVFDSCQFSRSMGGLSGGS